MVKVKLEITERQADLLLGALRAELRHEGTLIDANEAQCIRAMIQNTKDQLYNIQVRGATFDK